jgi:hypothetical protein
LHDISQRLQCQQVAAGDSPRQVRARRDFRDGEATCVRGKCLHDGKSPFQSLNELALHRLLVGRDDPHRARRA